MTDSKELDIFFSLLQDKFKAAQQNGHFLFWLPPQVQMGVLLKEIKEYFDHGGQWELVDNMALTALAIIYAIRKPYITKAIESANEFTDGLSDSEQVSQVFETGEESRNSEGEGIKAEDTLDFTSPV